MNDPLADVPPAVTIVEVGPRDGLQNEARTVPLEAKVRLIEDLAEAGLKVIEAGAFVSPRWVPQMADSVEVLRTIRRRPGVRYPVLVPNARGLEAALAVGVDEIAVFAAASESFSQKNINCSIAGSLERFAPVMERAKAEGVRVRGYVSCVVGCPYEGVIAPSAVAGVAGRLHAMGCYEVSLGDTVGVGTPRKVAEMVRAVAGEVPVAALAIHAHDTYGQALANVLTCLEMGIGTVDSSVAGLGGCPYAPGASGNLATEDVVYMLEGMGVATGVDLGALVATARVIGSLLDRGSRGRAHAVVSPRQSIVLEAP
ncbi:MAG TPA: hydroxymethylglutaryl-CoA lyase [Geminicoccaceae bacterium]|nr:hydroxymethylglutaryl-CoA lyase [Geminicoccus sp.]HMU51447.1 hydroxymethylglutaryl-CoA lyase [Geminicoccaceae bacterium]